MIIRLFTEDISIDNIIHCVDDWKEDMDLEWVEHVVDTKFGINDLTATHLAAKYDRVESIFNNYNLARYN